MLCENPFYALIHLRDFMIKTHPVDDLTEAMVDAASILRSKECRHLWDEAVEVQFFSVSQNHGDHVCQTEEWDDEDITLTLSRH